MSGKETKGGIELESHNGLSNLEGTIAMARTNVPNSAESQFFINVKDNNFLDYVDEANPGYAVFGKVVKGMDVVHKIEQELTITKYGMQDWPMHDVVVTKAYIKK